MFGSVFIFHFALVAIDAGLLLRQTFRFPLYLHDIFIDVMKSTPQRLKSDCFHHPDEISATEISLGGQRRERRRDVFSENNLNFTI